MWAVVPVKDIADAKARLAPALSPIERRRLFRAMLEDVLTALSRARGLAGVAIVTRDPEAQALAAGFGFRVIAEEANRGHRAAVAHASARLRLEGAGGLIQIPGDVPLVTAAEVEQVLAAHGPAPAVSLVPSDDGRGSNCLAASPPDAIPFLFGDVSFAPHREAARARGIEPTVLRLPGLGLDIDTVADLARLADRPGATRAQRYLQESGIAGRLAPEARERPTAVGG